MRWRRRDTAIMTRFLEAMFSLIGEEEAEHIEGLGKFKYLGRLLYLSDDNCTSVMPNIRKARQVWGQLGNLLQREGPTVLQEVRCTVPGCPEVENSAEGYANISCIATSDPSWR